MSVACAREIDSELREGFQLSDHVVYQIDVLLTD